MCYCYALAKGDLKLRGSKAPRRTEVTEKVDKRSLPSVWQVSLGNAESAVATVVVILTVY
jgi:hypothetical protein